MQKCKKCNKYVDYLKNTFYSKLYVNQFSRCTFCTFLHYAHSEVPGSTTFHLGLAPSLVQCVHFPAPLRYRPADNSQLFSSVPDTLLDSPIHPEHASLGYTGYTSVLHRLPCSLHTTQTRSASTPVPKSMLPAHVPARLPLHSLPQGLPPPAVGELLQAQVPVHPPDPAPPAPTAVL